MPFSFNFAPRLFAKVKQQLLPPNQIPPSIHPTLDSSQMQKDAFPMAMANEDPHGAMHQQDLNAVYHIQKYEVPLSEGVSSVVHSQIRLQDHQDQHQQHQQQPHVTRSNSTEPDPGLGIGQSNRLSEKQQLLEDRNGDRNGDSNDLCHHQSILSNEQDRRVSRPQSIGTLNTQQSATATSTSTVAGLQHSHSLNHLSDRPKPERLRDHAKVFPLLRSRTGSVNEHLNGRNTPLMRSRETLQGISVDGSPVIMPQQGSSSLPSPTVSTPTTPLSRGEIGYMGNQTLRAFNTLPRSSSMGYIAAVNNMNASTAAAPSSSSSSSLTTGSVANSTQGSPVISNGGSRDGDTTPNSLKSYRSTSSFFAQQNRRRHPSEALAAERGLDEHLKAIRRRSFAAEVMNSPAGAPSPTCIDITSLRIEPTNLGPLDPDPNNENFGGITESPRSAGLSQSKSFRMSFSSPNVGTLQRRSSMALKSVLNSIVNSPVASDSSSVISSSSSGSSETPSPRLAGNLTHPTGLGAGQSEQPPLSAKDLLRAEYGDIYTDVMQQLSSSSNSNEQGLALIQDLDARLQPYADESATAAVAHQQDLSQSSAPSVSTSGTPQRRRSRSASVSSAWTAQTSSSGSSDSSTSTHSNLTSLSNEDRRNSIHGSNNIATSKPPGPPPTAMNRVHHSYQHQHKPRPMLSLLRRGSSNGLINTCDLGDGNNQRGGTRSGNTTPVSKKFPSQGDLSSYSWDYRRELPVD